MKTLKHLALCLAAAFIATGCSNDENEPKNGAMKEGKPVKFEMSISNTNTRTSTDAESRMTSWAKGDAVGIFVYDESGEAVYNNVKYEYNGTDWQATGASGGIMIEDGVTYKYYAYYPYNAESNSAANISLSAITEQNEGNNYDLSDILAARNTDEKTDAENGIVPLLFKHMFAMVEVSLYGDKVANQPTSVKLLNVQQEATMNLAGSTDVIVTPSGEATNIEMKYLGTKKNAHAYRAVVPAQTINASTPLVAVYGATDGKDYQFSYSVPVPYEQGRYRIMEVKIGEADSGITIPKKNMNIDPWTPASSVDGDGSYEEIVIKLIKPVGDTFGNNNECINESTLASTTEEGWYKFASTAEQEFATFNIVDASERTWGKALQLTYAPANDQANNSWYKSVISYLTKEIPQTESNAYQMKLYIKSSDVAGPIMLTIRNATNDASFICHSNEKTFLSARELKYSEIATQKIATMSTHKVTEANKWQETSLFIDLNHIAKGNPGSFLETEDKFTENRDFSRIEIRAYTNLKGTQYTIEISDVTLEPYTIPAQ